ncbi:Bug family tripartite tricarboxylate transporter substrate binding protein [Lampropedia aestuarii]|uniref:Bug family tripartite tricarboxylate transporter substrate binding protein n=1 Tax=Lampropedia aestuarii TaxID=2562762 RepID=UPI0024695E08|nr:tripartite tricarboxylate transporter substrate binding protein [Lampropedia aestuarii]MDH5858752.1 tripartite tricarboxylate transporter substrate binding protein [Lampropedia aestuarii]
MFKKVLTAAAIGLTLTVAAAQSWPTKPVRMVVPFPPGGGTDILARLVSAKLSEAHGWNIVADNRPGVGGTLGITEAARATPDGYNFVFGQKDNLVIGPWLYKNLTWNPVKDFAPVAHVAYSPVLIATSADSPYQTLADVVAAAKKAPDSITYGSPGNGTSIHLAATILEKEAGIKLVHVPYKGSNPAMLDVIAGNVQLLSSSVPSALGQIKAGKLRPLAVTSATRSSSLPDVPTVQELGIEGIEAFDVATWYGVMAPAGTPEDVVNSVNAAVNTLLTDEAVRSAMQAQGAEPLAMGVAEFGEFLNKDYTAWESVVKDSGVQLD